MPWMMVMPPPGSPATGVPPGSGAVPVAVPAAAMAFPASPAQAQAYAAQYHAAMVQRMAQVGGAARAARYRLCLGCGVWSSKALLALCMPGLRLLANAAATSTWSRQDWSYLVPLLLLHLQGGQPVGALQFVPASGMPPSPRSPSAGSPLPPGGPPVTGMPMLAPPGQWVQVMQQQVRRRRERRGLAAARQRWWGVLPGWRPCSPSLGRCRTG